MKFLVDAQLPPALALWLRDKGHDANHVPDLGLLRASDAEIRERAKQSGAVLVTKDRDFVSPANDDAGPVIWIRAGNLSNAALLTKFAAVWPQVITHPSEGRSLVEVR